MRLVSCYIEGFGKLKQKEYSFEKGISAFCEENGSGKSTLAAFLKAMFYGMDSNRKNAKDFVDRLHYYPFEGTCLGGNLVFEMGGDTYKIERFFDERSDTLDTLTVYRNGSVYTGLGSDVGKSVFGIDKASFERTAFVDAAEMEIASTMGINAKLNRFWQGAKEDEGDLEEALAALEKASKAYKKAKAGKDKISEETAHIDALHARIINLQKIKESLDGEYEKQEKTEARIRDLEEQLHEEQKKALVLKDWEQYEALLSEIEKEKTEYEAILARYPHGIPTREELDIMQSALLEDEKYRSQAGVETFSAEDEEQYCRLAASFKAGVPDKEQLASLKSLLDESEARKASLESLKPSVDETKRQFWEKHFAVGVPSEEALSSAEALAADYRKAEKAYHETPAQLAVTERVSDGENSASKRYLVMAILASLLLVSGVGIVFFSLVAGVLLLAVGAVVLLIDGFLYLNKKTALQVSERVVQKDNPEKAMRFAEWNALADRLRSLLVPYGFLSDDDILMALAALKREALDYIAFLAKEKERQEQLARVRADLSDTLQKIADFLGSYGIEESDSHGFYLLQRRIDDFTLLSSRRKKALDEREALDNKRRDNLQRILSLCQKYSLESPSLALLTRIADDEKACRNYVKLLDEKKCRAAAVQKEKGLYERPRGDAVALDEVQKALARLRDELTVQKRVIEENELAAEQLDDLLAQEQEAKERLRIYKERYKLLKGAMTFLEKAAGNLKEKYVKPVKDQFTYYADLVEKTLGEKITMDQNYEIRFERFGKERDDKHLSAGQRSLCALAFRLALVRNMYPEELPFLVLDDPFLTLDAPHMDKVRALFGDLAHDFQIIYFTCHESRML